ncbi:RelA/SpoT family protein [Thiolapillus sp.]
MVSSITHLPKSGKLGQEHLAAWLAALAGRRSREEIHDLSVALDIIHQVHDEEPAFGDMQHQLALVQTADILDQLNLDTETLIAGLLSDLPNAELKHASCFGERVQSMIRDLVRIRTVAVTGSADTGDKQSENLRRMLLGLADDVRVVLIVLAKRLQLMRVIHLMGSEDQRRIAAVTQRIHAPLANRLGIWQIKWELEDLSLRVLHPDAYREIANALEEKREERELFIEQVTMHLEGQCAAHGIAAHISGRPKHIYSIWKKMQRKGVDFSQIFDVRAVRVLVDTVAECYEVLGMVHGAWQPIPKEFDDYIAHPKANGYRSLHTAVVGDDGKPLEVQIRTRKMHDHAERGVAAHWRYKEDGKGDAELERRIEWMRAWLEQPGEVDVDAEGTDAEFEAQRIYVLTPDGKVVELPRGATAVDFAYAIHSSVGHRCRGAKADGKMISLTQPLESGQTVEIITAKQGGPSLDWINFSSGYVVTSRARNRIRHWFKRQDYDQHVSLGKASLDKETSRLGVKKPDLEGLLPKYNFKSVDDLYAAIGRGEVSATQIANLQIETFRDDDEEITAKAEKRVRQPPGKGGQIVVEGVDDLMTHTARCCKPVPYDPIVGYITRGRGVTIHREDCSVVKRLREDQAERLIPVNWSEDQPKGAFLVDVQIYAHDRKGLLRDVSSVFSNEEVDVLGVKTHTDRKKEKANMRFTTEVTDMAQLSKVLEKLAQIPDVLEVRRQT